METLLIIIITIPLGLLILCGGYAVWSKTQVGTRDNLAGEQRGNREFHLNRDRNRMMYSVAVGEALNADSTAQRQNQLPTMNIDRAFAEAKARAEADKRGQEGR